MSEHLFQLVAVRFEQGGAGGEGGPQWLAASSTENAISSRPVHCGQPSGAVPVGSSVSSSTDPVSWPAIVSKPKTSTPTPRTAHAANAMNRTPIGPTLCRADQPHPDPEPRCQLGEQAGHG